MTSYRDWLKEEIERRRSKNPSYSLRAFARDLGLSPSAVSLVLQGRRHFSKKTMVHLAKTLSWNSTKKEQALREIGIGKSSPGPNRIELSEEDFKYVDRWYVWAILGLASTGTFSAQIDSIAERLGISKAQASRGLKGLMRLGIVSIRDGYLHRSFLKGVKFVPKAKQKTRKTHQEILRKALEAVSDPAVDDGSRIELFGVIPMSKAKLKEVEYLVQRMIISVGAVGRRSIQEETADEVFGLVVHAFPLTRGRSRKKSKQG